MKCKCGCGRDTTVYRGKDRYYIHGHNGRDRCIRYCEKCGISSVETRIVKYKRKIYLCNRHRIQMSRHGKMFERTIYDKNKITQKKHYYEMELYNSNGEIINHTIFDTNVEDVRRYKWHFGKDGYVSTCIDGETYFLHWLILGRRGKNKLVVDHINRDKLDNRIENLRLTTRRENFLNSDKIKRGQSNENVDD